MSQPLHDAVLLLPLSPFAKLVLQGLLKHADYVTGGDAWPSVERLSRYAGCSARTAQGALAALRRGHWISQQAPATRRRPTTYQVHFDRILAAAARLEAQEVRPSQGCKPRPT